MKITRTAKIRKSTKKALQDVRVTQRELQILRKSQELWKLWKLATSQRDTATITRITKTAKIRKGTKNGLQDVRGTQRELRILRKLRELRKLRKFAKTSEGPNENYENCEYSQKYQEWLTRCQREPTRTANFTTITIIVNICKDLRGTQWELRKLRKYVNVPRKPQTCQRVLTRTASFMKITRITKIANIRKDRCGSRWELQKLQKFPKWKSAKSAKFLNPPCLKQKIAKKRKSCKSCLSAAKNRKIRKFVDVATLKQKIVKFGTEAKNGKIRCRLQSWT